MTDKPAISRYALMSLIAASLGMFVGAGVTIIYAASVFVPAIVADTGWSRSGVTAAIAPAALAIALSTPIVGALTDRYGPRRVLIVAAFPYAASLAAISIVSINVSMFTAALTVAAIFSAATTPVAYSRLIIGWMPEQRGLGMGIAMAFSGLGVAVVPALLAQFLPSIGWKIGYAILGMAALLVILPTAIFLVKDPPRREVPKVDVAYRQRGTSTDLTFKEALGTPAFWTLSAGFLLNGLTATAGSISLPLVAGDHGVAPAVAATTMISVGLSMVVSRVVVGALFDRLPAILLAAIIFCAPVLAYLMLIANVGFPGFIVAALLFGIAVGTEGDAMAVILSKRFGLRGFGKIFGVNFAAYALCGGLGPWLLTTLRSTLASDRLAFLYLAAIGLAAVIAISFNRSSQLGHE